MPFPSPSLFPGGDVFPGELPPDPPPKLDAKIGAQIPHFILPFRFSGSAASVVEQDSTDDVLVCVLAILLCPMGYRAEVPGFGVDDLTFRERQPDIQAVANAIAEWEPRADAGITTERDRLDDLVHYVSIQLGTRSTD